MIIWWNSHFKNNTSREKNVGTVLIPSGWATDPPGDGRYRCSSYKQSLRTYHLCQDLIFLLFFFNRTVIFFPVEIYCNCASHILIAVHNWGHINSSKWSFPDDSQSTTYWSITLHLCIKSRHSCGHHQHMWVSDGQRLLDPARSASLWLHK